MKLLNVFTVIPELQKKMWIGWLIGKQVKLVSLTFHSKWSRHDIGSWLKVLNLYITVTLLILTAIPFFLSSAYLHFSRISFTDSLQITLSSVNHGHSCILISQPVHQHCMEEYKSLIFIFLKTLCNQGVKYYSYAWIVFCSFPILSHLIFFFVCFNYVLIYYFHNFIVVCPVGHVSFKI